MAHVTKRILAIILSLLLALPATALAEAFEADLFGEEPAPVSEAVEPEVEELGEISLGELGEAAPGELAVEEPGEVAPQEPAIEESGEIAPGEPETEKPVEAAPGGPEAGEPGEIAPGGPEAGEPGEIAPGEPDAEEAGEIAPQEPETGEPYEVIQGEPDAEEAADAEADALPEGEEYAVAAPEAAGDGNLVSKSTEVLYFIMEDGTESFSLWHLLSSSEANDITFAMNSWEYAAYALPPNESITVNHRIRVKGNVYLLLGDNATLTVNGGLSVYKGSSLTIFCQRGGTGKLIANGWPLDPGIGGDYEDYGVDGSWKTGTINICGGNIEANGGDKAAGIGNGYTCTDGSINIYGGTVTAHGGLRAPGIGGGYGSWVSKVHIYGGTVNASGGYYAAGIGGGQKEDTLPEDIVIDGGTVNATGGDFGAGIGGGDNAAGGATINGGTVNATGTYGGAGIGGGYFGSGTIILINGGTVNATGGTLVAAAGIGGGYGAKSGEITITGGTITAVRGENSDPEAHLRTHVIGAGAHRVDYSNPGKYEGTLNLGDRVRVGKMDGDAIEWVPAVQRVGVCRGWDKVRVEICSNHSYEDGACVYCNARQAMVARPKPSSDPLIVTVHSTGDTSLNAAWNAVQGADGYDVFFARCGSEKFKLSGSVAGDQPLTFDFTGLRKNRGYKVVVKAYIAGDGEKQYVKQSPVSHCYTASGAKNLANPASLTLKKDALTVKLGKTAVIRASVKGAKRGKLLDHGGKLRYLSSDPSVASVSTSGRVKGKGPGSCAIYVLTSNGIWKSATVTVDASPSKVKLNRFSRVMKVGSTQDLGAKVKLTPAKAVTALTWTSSDPAVASVDESGVVTALGRGKATITVTTENGKEASVKLRVK